MRQDIFYPSLGGGQLRACIWTPDREPRAVLQIVHGIAERVERYDYFASFLNRQDFLVVAEDHMGHGGSVREGELGYFRGGWFTAVEDSYRLMTDTMAAHPGLPYVLFGHSMGSFMARTLLCTHPDSGIAAAIICGTGWQPAFALPALIRVVEAVCAQSGETTPSPALEKLMFGAYNKRVEHPRTKCDWLTRDAAVVDAYMADPLCGFTPSAGLVRDMLTGILYIEKKENLDKMRKDLPVFFIAGGDDPVGSYGKGVRKAAQAFREAGMQDITTHIYPLDRHEILNEINKDEVCEHIARWLRKKIGS
ncbi:MAG: alpha/beta fold hydrolase [Eubacteriales bacterium]|nr:alpha/beta fold hydrolase [Eubacteriales bacterium]